MANTLSTAARTAPTLAQLRTSITDIDRMSQSALSEIITLAELAVLALPTDDRTRPLAAALRSILGKAWDLENDINATAERVGCNFAE